MDFCRALAPTLILVLTALHAACGLANPASTGSPSTASPANSSDLIFENFRHDASLADICFINRTTGWAVGDRGVIWHTQDGGASWQQQTSNVHCRLKSVYFIDAHHGWAAGGDFLPHTAASRGLILRTDDGGNTWTSLSRLLLPLLTRIKFFDHNRGIAIGLANSTQPSGIFLTQDGGDTWQPIQADRGGGWLTGDFIDLEAGAVAGAAGNFAQLARHRLSHPSPESHSMRSFRAMQLIPPTSGWLAGDGGLVLTTNDLGHSWQSPQGELPLAASQCDLHALAVVGPNIWLAGSPGTRVFHSLDNAQTWHSFSTGQSAPIRSITFVDSDHGYAVGDFGNILATTDGGRTWKSQRAGGQRAALLAIFADAADVPLEVIATHGAADGYLTAIDILHANDGEVASATGRLANDSPLSSQPHHDALLLAGASTVNTAWRFPLPPADLAHSPPELLAGLNRATDGRAIEQIEQHLVRAIRMWRPEVIITRNTNLDTCEPRAAILAALVMQAIDAASDPNRHVDLATETGLEPWKVKKVYGLLPPGSRGAESVDSNEFSPLLGVSLSSFVAPARPLIAPTNTSSRNSYDFDLLTSTIQNGDGPRGLFSGISIAAGSDARRPPSQLPTGDLDALRRTAERRRHLEALLQRTEGNAAWAAQVGQITEGLNANDGAEILSQLADGYRALARLDLAADTHYLIARRYPDHPHAARSLQWLIQFYASSEASHRLASRGSHNVRQTGLQTPPLPLQEGRAPIHPLPLGEGRGEGALADPVQHAAATTAANPSPTIALSRDDRLQRATQLAGYLRPAKPELYAEPRVRFAEVAALRQLGLANPAKRYFLTLRQLPENNPWRRCGDTETWLSKPTELPPPKTLGACRPTADRPYLDAQLTEPFWDRADRLRLSDAKNISSDTPPGEVRLAYDHDHLYIAIRCNKTPSRQPPARHGELLAETSGPPQPRPRDADLSQHDRVTLRFDTDRDFTTAFELSIDSRGWTHDACWGDAHWNPTWYVAAASDEQTWTIEAAVPLSELVEIPPTARHVWAVSAYRTIPGVGHQSWTGEAVGDSPDQFGLLIFE